MLAGSKEGPVDTSDFQAWKVSLLSRRGHVGSLTTLSLEALAKKAPDVTFIHDFPGPVRSNVARSGQGPAVFALKMVFKIIGPMFYIPTQESGERHLFLATSARYPAGTSVNAASRVPLTGEVTVARGTSGEIGSGVYSVDWDGESSGTKVEKLLAEFRKEGMVEKVWNHIEGEFKRITRLEAA